MPRPAPVLSLEEKAARYDALMERKRSNNQKYYETNPERFQTFYETNKERLNKRGSELKREKAAAKKAAQAAAKEAPCPGTPEVADL